LRPGQRIRIVRTSKPKSNSKKLFLAAVPGFFGLMGLSQLHQGKRAKGFAFFIAGLVASFVSSWYVLIPARFEALLTKGAFLPPYALSFLSSTNLSASLASKLSVDMIGVVMALWALQTFDAMDAFISRRTVAVISTAVSQKVTVPMPAVRRAIAAAPTQSFASSAERKPVN